MAETWTAIGLLAAALFGSLFYLSSRIDALSARMDSRFDRMDARVDALDSKFDARFDRVETRLSSVETRLSSVETRLSSVETRLGRAPRARRAWSFNHRTLVGLADSRMRRARIRASELLRVLLEREPVLYDSPGMISIGGSISSRGTPTRLGALEGDHGALTGPRDDRLHRRLLREATSLIRGAEPTVGTEPYSKSTEWLLKAGDEMDSTNRVKENAPACAVPPLQAA